MDTFILEKQSVPRSIFDELHTLLKVREVHCLDVTVPNSVQQMEAKNSITRILESGYSQMPGEALGSLNLISLRLTLLK